MSLPVANPALLPPGIAGAPPARPAAARPAAARPAAAPPATAGTADRGSAPSSGPSFADVLAQSAGASELRFSRHARDRLQQRGIDLGSQTLQRLAGGVARAAGKGSRESVVFVDGTAFVVSVKNNTVITAVGSDQMRDQVFTNIDSAVIA
jgi:flagellar operon protein